ncbi:MAG: PKD domain-containing protein, partial [Bacteroidetes bacterium]|nr:PKD domain-containing protein [Bacteroidota bacterium]
DTCTGKLTVSDTTGFHAGDEVLIFQMQGASVNTTNSGSFGQIQSFNSAGRCERARIDSVQLNAIFIHNRLLFNYNLGGKLQLVRLAVYANATVVDTLRPRAWDGITGGVLALEVSGTLTLNAPIVGDGLGFRGGSADVNPNNNCNWLIPETAYYYANGNWRGANKGEGIAIFEPGKELGRGPQANGGGGGNDHNSGGGGGGNLYSGGKGGDNNEPSTFGCSGHSPGIGGLGLNALNDRWYLGGGGGAGHTNNFPTGNGGNGGAILLIKAQSINGSMPFIQSNGMPGKTANGDGGGGGGGGGSIRLELTNPAPNLVLAAMGGNGGNTLNNNQSRCFGPGGGGSGGLVRCNQPINAMLNGGQAGVVTGSTNGCNGSTNGASAGQNGEYQPLVAIPAEHNIAFQPQITTQPQNKSVCEGNPVYFSIATVSGNWQYQWEINTGNGWQTIGANQGYSAYNSPNLGILNPTIAQNGYTFRCRVKKGNCSSLVSLPATLTLLPKTSAAFTYNIQNAQVVFNNTAQNAVQYYWSFGDGSNSLLPNPVHTYSHEGSFKVTFYAIGACDTAIVSQNLLIALAPQAGFSIPDTLYGCNSVEAVFINDASQNTTGFSWLFPGGTPATSNLPNPVVFYSNSGLFSATQIVNNVAGGDTLTKNILVQVEQNPLASFIVSGIFNGLVSVNNMSTAGAGYTWNFGDGSADVSAFQPQHQYSQSGQYTITLVVSNPCGASILQTQVQVTLVAVDELALARLPHVYPNPARQAFFIDCRKMPEKPLYFRVLDVQGREVDSQQSKGETFYEVDASTWSSGMYHLELFLPSGMVHTLMCKQ